MKNRQLTAVINQNLRAKETLAVIDPQQLAKEMKADLKRYHAMSEEERRERQAEYDDQYPSLPEMPLP